MRTTHSSEQKQAGLDRYFSGEGAGTIVADTGIPRSTVYSWMKTENEKREKKRGRVSIKAYNQLQEHVKRLEGMLENPAKLQVCALCPITRKVRSFGGAISSGSVQRSVDL